MKRSTASCATSLAPPTEALPRYQRSTSKAEALIAAVYLSGTNTRRVKRAMYGLFEGAVSKDVVSRAWRKVKVDRDARVTRSLANEEIVRLILDGTVIRTLIDKNATNISVLAAIGVRRDGQKVLLSIMNIGGESKAAWAEFLADLDARGLIRPKTPCSEDAAQEFPPDSRHHQAVALYSDLPTELSEKPYVGLIFDPDTHKISVGRAAIVRDVILKRYGLIKPSLSEHRARQRENRSFGGYCSGRGQGGMGSSAQAG